MEIVSIDDFRRLLLDSLSSFDERKELVIEEFGIDLPPDLEDGEPFLLFVYDYYIKSINVYNLTEQRIIKKGSKQVERTGTVKEFILEYLEEHKNTELKISDLRSVVDLKFEYSKKGKNPRTRVRKVLEEVELRGQLKRKSPDIFIFTGTE